MNYSKYFGQIIYPSRLINFSKSTRTLPVYGNVMQIAKVENVEKHERK